MLRSPAGIGKSQLYAKLVTLYGAALGIVWIAVDTTTNAEAIARAIPGAVVLRPQSAQSKWPRGRTHVPAAQDGRGSGPGWPAGRRDPCDDGQGHVCRFKEQGICPYQHQLQRLRSGEVRVFVFVHDYLALPATPMPKPDLVIADEGCFDHFIGEDEIGLDRLLPDAMPGWQTVGIESALAYRKGMSAVREALPDPTGILAGLRAHGLTTPEDFDEAIKYARQMEEEHFTGDFHRLRTTRRSSSGPSASYAVSSAPSGSCWSRSGWRSASLVRGHMEWCSTRIKQ